MIPWAPQRANTKPHGRGHVTTIWDRVQRTQAVARLNAVEEVAPYILGEMALFIRPCLLYSRYAAKE
jgi:hypothetical protein